MHMNDFFESSFSDVYSLCVAYPEPLADKLYSETKKFLEEHVAATLVKVKSGGEQNLLGNYHAAWEEFSRYRLKTLKNLSHSYCTLTKGQKCLLNNFETLETM